MSVSTACRVDAAAGSYARRTPEQSVLYLVVREHLETFLTMVREERGKDCNSPDPVDGFTMLPFSQVYYS